MLIEIDDDEYDRITHIKNEGHTSVFNLQSKDNGSNSDVIHRCGVKTGLGLLILDGEETYGDKPVGDFEDCHFEHVNELSVPDTIFLPSEMRSVVTMGADPRELSTSRAVVVQECNEIMTSDSLRSNQFCRTVAMMMMMVFVAAILSFGVIRNNIWKNEALQLREDIQRQKPLLPLMISLLMERDALLKNISLLEKEVHRNSVWISLYEDMLFTSNTIEEEVDPLLSIENCGIEASLTLSQCSKELQNWWPNRISSKTSSASNDGEETNDDGFTADMAKLVNGVKRGLAETTVQSYNFVEKVFTTFSYAGMKETFSNDDYIQSIVKPGVYIVSAMALGMFIKNALADYADSDDKTALMEFLF